MSYRITYAEVGTVTSTSSYVAVPLTVPGQSASASQTSFEAAMPGALSFLFQNTGASNDLLVKVVADNDRTARTIATQWVTVIAEFTLTASGGAAPIAGKTIDFTEFAFYAVLVKDASGGSHSTMTVDICHQRKN